VTLVNPVTAVTTVATGSLKDETVKLDAAGAAENGTYEVTVHATVVAAAVKAAPDAVMLDPVVARAELVANVVQALAAIPRPAATPKVTGTVVAVFAVLGVNTKVRVTALVAVA